MTNTTFKVGDRVRLTGRYWDRIPGLAIGDIVTIRHIDECGDPVFSSADGEEWYIYEDYEAELVEEAKQSTRDKHLDHIAGLEAVIRRRNQRIDNLETTVEKQEAKLSEQAAELEAWAGRWNEEVEECGYLFREPVLSLDTLARQLGLGTPEARSALELGAAAHQLAIDAPEKLVQLVKDARYVPAGKKHVELGREALDSLAKFIRKVEDADPTWVPIKPLSTPVTSDITANILRHLQKRIGEANAAKGFHEQGGELRRLDANPLDHDLDSDTVTQALRDYATARLALITTEVAEAIEEIRAGRAVDETYYPSETKGLSIPELRKPEGVPSELADVVIRSFDFAHEFGIDLPAMIEEKLAYNATRPKLHGKVM